MGARLLSRDHLLFLAMAAIWGVTWIPIRIGASAMPPILFAGTRFAAAGLLLLAWRGVSGAPGGVIARTDWPRVAAVAFLMVTATYAPLFWAARHVPTGVAAVIDFALMPVALLGFAVLMREEVFDRGRAVAVGCGVIGVLCLSWSSLTDKAGANALEGWGVAAIVLSVVAYCLGSVVARPLLRAYPASSIAGVVNLIGGAVLIIGSLGFEPGALAALSRPWPRDVWLSWAFLVFFGSLAGYTIYLLLIRDWGPSRAGAFAFVSPVVAVAMGMVVFGERLGWIEAGGVLLMLLGAVLALRARREVSKEPAAP